MRLTAASSTASRCSLARSASWPSTARRRAACVAAPKPVMIAQVTS